MSTTSNLKDFSNSFRQFLTTKSKYIVCFCLFYALWITKAFVLGQEFILHSFPGRMIGVSTLNGYDVSARVSMFYKALGVLLGSFFAFSLLAWFISKKKPALVIGTEARIINYTSIAAILLFLFGILGYSVSGTMALIYFIHKSMLAALLIRLFFFPKNRLTIYNYTFVLLISLSVNYLILDLISSANKDIYAQFFLSALVISCLFIVYLNTLLKKDGGIKQPSIDKLVYCLLPLVFLTFATVLKDEIFLIFKARQIHLGGPVAIYVFLLLLLAGWIVFRNNAYKKTTRLSQKKLLATTYFPVFIFSIVAYARYSYTMNFTGEMFEDSNKLLPIMEFKLFGVIPTLEKFNTHVLSDYFFPAIYTLLNGLGGTEMLSYDFLYVALVYTLYYYLIFYVSRNSFISLFCVVFFPFTLAMLPEAYGFGVFAFFALQRMFDHKPSLKNYIIFFSVLAGVLLWRIDLGVTCIPVMILLMIYYHFVSREFKLKPAMALKGAMPVAGVLLLLILCFCLYRSANLLQRVPYAYNYLSSAQTWGYPNLGENQPAYRMHYFVFPGIVGAILIALLLSFKRLNKSRNQRFAYLALIFVCAYYLANFNRGLVRHGLIENVDYYASSYIYLIIPAAFLVFFRNQKQVVRYAGFFLIVILLLFNYKVPTIPSKAQSFFDLATEKVLAKKPVNLARLESRITDTLHLVNTDSSFVKFINKNTTADETFIDFSNNPMLYFYAKKITPSYFYQNPTNSHNDFLQDHLVSDFAGYKTPYAVFSRTDSRAWDDVDQVPNTIRHYRVAEYMYQNYKPYIVASRYHIWKANNVKDNNTTDTIYHFTKNQSPTAPVLFLTSNLTFKPGKKYMARFTVAQPINLVLKTFFNADSVTQSPEYINDNLAFCVIEPRGNQGVFKLENIYDQLIDYQIIECENLPDFYFEKPVANDFSLLPYVWGTFDKKVSQELILVDASPSTSGAPTLQLQKNTAHNFKIPESIDRTSGNTVLITCRNNVPAMQKLTLSFGDAREKTKTKIDFIVIPSGREETYAIRISSMYRWYSNKVNELSLSTESEGIVVSKINVTKGM